MGGKRIPTSAEQPPATALPPAYCTRYSSTRVTCCILPADESPGSLGSQFLSSPLGFLSRRPT
ncbi:unnamed protein product [Tuber melanosporum]|uniref:(Perigord truffle) hypothetical protein n=1 Tax=Tuber melanosporum (strain Mel28) TaxID=656061 RepID=D5GNV2_TUBMM|nr:uncharacterized protein GSTUM_00011523001 [Tuber melanosporum]CAZ86195.1 unnamed protein product [Tuber melanosporum]